MDINDLKQTWKDSFNEQGRKSLSPEEIKEKLAIKSRSGTLISKIKRNLMIEIIIATLIMIALMLYISPDISGRNEWLTLALFMVFFVALLLNVYIKYHQLNKIQIYDDKLSPAIQKMIEISEKYIRFNTGKVGKYIILPLGILFGLSMGFIVGAGTENLLEKLQQISSVRLALVVLWILFVYGISIPLTIWFNRKFYGQYVKELKENLEELMRIEEEA